MQLEVEGTHHIVKYIIPDSIEKRSAARRGSVNLEVRAQPYINPSCSSNEIFTVYSFLKGLTGGLGVIEANQSSVSLVDEKDVDRSRFNDQALK